MSWKPPEPGQLPEGWTATTDREPARIFGVRLSAWAIIVGVLLVGSIIAGVAGPGGDSATSFDDDAYGAHAACAEFTRDRLKAPATADFPEYDDNSVSISHAGSDWTVRSFVDADNSFGASIRTSFVCVVTDLRETWRLQSWSEG